MSHVQSQKKLLQLLYELHELVSKGLQLLKTKNTTPLAPDMPQVRLLRPCGGADFGEHRGVAHLCHAEADPR